MTIDLRKIPALFLNLQRDEHKQYDMMQLLKGCGFEVIVRVEGVNCPENPTAGCSKAHYKGLCVMEPPFILFEDDCRLNTFNPIVSVPDDLDALYLGNSAMARSNAHVGSYLEYERVSGYEELYRVYNMLSGHAVLYYGQEYVNMCKRITYHAGYVVEHYQDWGFADIQKWFNVYTFDMPFFYQTSHESISNKRLTEYPRYNTMNYNITQFRPQPFFDSMTLYPKKGEIPGVG